ncbi:MAG: glycoside hydrolase family 16 protein [Akkermansiaceae bacterium]|nr:glycoside hydrolase family 16 protein [Akkermansiaceae bacterium]
MNRRIILPLILLLSASVHSAQADWQLIWSDEFKKRGAVDPKKWNVETDFVRNEKAKQIYTDRPENITQKDGRLVLTARTERRRNGRYDPDGHSWLVTREYADYTSGSVNSAGKFSFKYGRVVIRAAIERGRGVWPALWLIGRSPGKTWPQCGEIDILEYISQDADRVHGTLHWDNSYAGPGKGRTVSWPAANLLRGFHEYEMIWTPEKIEFFYDGRQYYSFEIARAQTGDYNAFRNPFHLILNLAIGGWAENPDPKDYPRTFQIDYVRVYQDKNQSESEYYIDGQRKSVASSSAHARQRKSQSRANSKGRQRKGAKTPDQPAEETERKASD